jgi:moderate conductance mechanosensitive channel
MRNAVPRMVPEWKAAKDRIAAEMQGHGTIRILRGFAFVLLVGYGAELLLRYVLRRSASRSAVQFGRGLAALSRIAPLVVFAVAAIAALALAEWPRQLEAAVAPLLIAWIGARLLIAIASTVFKPAYEGGGAAETREEGLSLAPDAARFWHRRFVLFACALAFLWAAIDMMQAHAFPADVRDLTAAALGLVIKRAIKPAASAWRRPRLTTC